MTHCATSTGVQIKEPDLQYSNVIIKYISTWQLARTKASAINSKQPLHQRPLESKWRPAPEVNSLVAQPVLTINSTGTGTYMVASMAYHN